MEYNATRGSRITSGGLEHSNNTGGDTYTIDRRTGGEIYVERDTKRTYSLDEAGGKVYAEVKEAPKYGGAATWRTDGGGVAKAA